MRRSSIMLLALLTAVSLLILPGQSASAEDSAGVERLHALVTGFTDPDENPHSLGVNRVSGESEFERLAIAGELECDDDEVVVFNVEQADGHLVRYTTDDDVTDGFGEVHGTDSERGFRDAGATVIRLTGTSTVEVEIRILEGRFHRIGNWVDVDLRLDIRVEEGGVEICEAADHEIRITFLIIGPDPDGEGFSLAGVARTHELPEDRTSLARTVCDTVVDTVVGDTRVSEPLPTDPTTPISPGRGDFHPCGTSPPE